MADPDIETKPSLLDVFGARPESDPPPSVPATTSAVTIPAWQRGAIKCEVKRDEREILQKVKALAAYANEDWYYRFPVKDKKTNRTNWIEGATIKCANEIWRIYGNIDVNTDVIDLGDSWMIKAYFFDKETGSSMARVFQQRKSQRSIGDDPERQRDAALQIGVSKAIRNVITNSLQTLSDFAFKEARGSLANRIGKDLERYRETTIRKLEPKIDLKRVEAVMGRVSKDWLAPDIAQVIAMMQTIQDGMATWDEMFPPLGKSANDNGKSANDNGEGLDQVAKEENSGSHPSAG